MSAPSPAFARVSAAVNRRAAGDMLLASFAFATMSCIAHGFRGQAPWPAVALARIAVTPVLMYAVLAATGIPMVWIGSRALWWRSIGGTIGLLCNFYALTRLPITDVVTVLSTSPVWVAVILAVAFRRPLLPGVWLHAALAVAGVYVMHRPAFSAEALPLLITLLGAIVIATVKISLSFCGRWHAYTVVAHYSTCATLISLALCLLVNDPRVDHVNTSLGLWWWLLPMGLAGTGAQIMMTRAYAKGATTMVALVSISQIPFAAAYDLIVWGHGFDAWKIAGICIIAGAIALSVRANARAGGAPEPCEPE